MAHDYDNLDDETFGLIAATAFKMGLEDGRRTAVPMSAEKLIRLFAPRHYRVMHKLKVRQVYGAGFDISRMAVRIAKEGN